jgi:chaperonin GroES
VSFQPLGNLILTKVVEPAAQTSGGIYIPPTALARQNQQVEVVAVGPGLYQDGQLVPVNVQVGNILLTQVGAGLKVNVDGGDYVLLREQDALGIVA